MIVERCYDISQLTDVSDAHDMSLIHSTLFVPWSVTLVGSDGCSVGIGIRDLGLESKSWKVVKIALMTKIAMLPRFNYCGKRCLPNPSLRSVNLASYSETEIVTNDSTGRQPQRRLFDVLSLLRKYGLRLAQLIYRIPHFSRGTMRCRSESDISGQKIMHVVFLDVSKLSSGSFVFHKSIKDRDTLPYIVH